MDLLRKVCLRVNGCDVGEVRSLLAARRLDGITFSDNAAWWRFAVRFSITGPAWAIERATRDIDRLQQDGSMWDW